MPIMGVLFDIDDTLVDHSASEAVGLLAHLESEGLLDQFPDHATALSVWRDIMDRHYARFLEGEVTYTGQQLARTREFLAHTINSTHADLSDAEATAWFAGYKAHRHAVRSAFPDAEPVLRKLVPDYRLGVVSNSSVKRQRHKLDLFGLLPYFGDTLVCSNEHGVAKPAASIFLAGCALLGLHPNEVAYVGDKYDIDAVGAHEAGLHAYWLDRANTGVSTAIDPGIHVIGSLDELPAALTSPPR
ncbi:putative hydrolase of the HAD superfamily [Stackebrandtia albiflava]|uniref:Putative hydrolase of the HAD superfamily n=1 Tax=Stackebrandtia albiflava TaxID=406432 RepID=A0A562VDL9_9ACTN|nr:HAD family hydrolase [Stackebrandtia albiflava]TWJ15911.1 putative hydrolase of the HAD superfamily [Stackebrandtia albiflava]